MKTSPDGSDPAAVIPATMLVLCLIFLMACHKPSKKNFIDSIAKSDTLQNSENTKTKKHFKKKSRKKKLYLTFDDGPNKGTKNVLTIVQDEEVPVSFFLIGEHVYASHTQHALWDSLHAATDVEICNHSFTHAWNNSYGKFYKYPDSVIADFKRNRDSLSLTNNIVRTPGRNIWRIDSLNFTDLKSTIIAADSLSNAGFNLLGWDVEWHYNPKTLSVSSTADEVLNNIDSAFKYNRTKQKDHLVLLAHDQVYRKSDDSMQLRLFLQKLKLKDEYEFSVVTSYPGTMKNTGIADTFKTKGVSQ